MMRLKWLNNEENVMHWAIEGDWTQDSYLQTFESWVNLASIKPYAVDLILDMQNAGRMPANTISLMWQATLERPKNLGVTIVVSDSKLVRTVFKSMTQIYGATEAVIIFSADWEGAMDILKAAQNSRVAR